MEKFAKQLGRNIGRLQGGIFVTTVILAGCLAIIIDVNTKVDELLKRGKA